MLPFIPYAALNLSKLFLRMFLLEFGCSIYQALHDHCESLNRLLSVSKMYGLMVFARIFASQTENYQAVSKQIKF